MCFLVTGAGLHRDREDLGRTCRWTRGRDSGRRRQGCRQGGASGRRRDREGRHGRGRVDRRRLDRGHSRCRDRRTRSSSDAGRDNQEQRCEHDCGQGLSAIVGAAATDPPISNDRRHQREQTQQKPERRGGRDDRQDRRDHHHQERDRPQPVAQRRPGPMLPRRLAWCAHGVPPNEDELARHLATRTEGVTDDAHSGLP